MMEAKRIDLEEWEYFGEGGSSTSYARKVGENLILKLNNRDIPVATTEKEYLASKAFNEAGFPSPKIYDFVTDGERYGYTSQRINGKLSFARMLSQEPDSAERLAWKFADMARKLHATEADGKNMTDAGTVLLDALGDLSYVPEDVAEKVRKSFSSIGKDRKCLHGDMNPGNLINFENKYAWIGVNEFSYGDPYLDIATLYIICHLLPARKVKRLYHTEQSVLKIFFTAFKKTYFGKEWNSGKVEARIRDAAAVRFCAAAASNPDYVGILIPFVRGNGLKLFIKRSILSLRDK